MNYHCKTDRMTEVFVCDLAAARFTADRPLPSEMRLAEQYHVSRSTIRRVLENLIADGTLRRDDSHRVRINPVRSQRHPLPPAADSDPAARKRTIVWAYAAYPDPMIYRVTTGIHRYAAENASSVELQMLSSQEGHEPVLAALGGARRLGIDGVLLLNFMQDSYTRTINALLDEGIPVVTVGPAGASRASSCTGDASGAFNGVSALIEKYDRPVWLVAAPAGRDALNDSARYHAWGHAMRNAGFGDDLDKYICCILNGDEPKYWPMEQKLFRAAYQFAPHFDRMTFPASVFCHDDYIANRLYLAAKERNLKIGSDLAVLSFDDLPFARRLTPPLASVRVESEQLGYLAAKLLHQSMEEGFPAPVHLKVPSVFIERESM